MKISKIRVGVEMTLKLFPDRQDYQFFKPMVEIEAELEKGDDVQEIRKKLWEDVRKSMGEQIDSIQSVMTP